MADLRDILAEANRWLAEPLVVVRWGRAAAGQWWRGFSMGNQACGVRSMAL